MSEFEISKLRNSNVAYLYATRREIDMNPSYQRQGAIWSIYKQQLLIDSLINGFDVPKIYLHQFPLPRTLDGGQRVRYALVDGKQRLEAIFGFMDGAFGLDEGLELITDAQVDAKGLTYGELQDSQPSLISLFNSTSLDVVTIRTDDIELIEEMFSRLNEAVPLNAAEKRNALGGPCPAAVRVLSNDAFFELKLPFTNSRYRYFDLAAKFLYWEDQIRDIQSRRKGANPGKVLPVRDVKKYRLDAFFREMRTDRVGVARIERDKGRVLERLTRLSSVFTDSDPLLASIGMVSLFFLLDQWRESEGRRFPSRRTLQRFEDGRKSNRVRDEDDLRPGQFQLLEFDRLAQSPNDGSALSFRLRVLDAYCNAIQIGRDPVEAVEEATKADNG